MVVKELINKNTLLNENECKKIVEELVELKNLAPYYNAFNTRNIAGGLAGYNFFSHILSLNIKNVKADSKIHMKRYISLLRYFRRYSYNHLQNFLIIHALFHEVYHMEQLKKICNLEISDLNLIESFSNYLSDDHTYINNITSYLFEYDAEIHADYDFLTLADKYYEHEEGPLFMHNKALLSYLFNFYSDVSINPRKKQYDYFIKEYGKANKIVTFPNMSELENLLHGNEIKKETFHKLLMMCYLKNIKTRNFFNEIDNVR